MSNPLFSLPPSSKNRYPFKMTSQSIQFLEEDDDAFSEFYSVLSSYFSSSPRDRYKSLYDVTAGDICMCIPPYIIEDYLHGSIDSSTFLKSFCHYPIQFSTAYEHDGVVVLPAFTSFHGGHNSPGMYRANVIFVLNPKHYWILSYTDILDNPHTCFKPVMSFPTL